MNSFKKPQFPLHLTGQQAKQPGQARQLKPGIVQLKSGLPPVQVKHPAAPPAYRPQPIPKVLQRKLAGQQQPPAGQPERQQIVAPPVYRPQATPKVLQTKASGSRQPQSTQLNLRPIAPPAYRPQPVPKVLQTKMAASRQAGGQTRRVPAAPPVYRPQPTAKSLQLMRPQLKEGKQNLLARNSPSVVAQVNRPQPSPKVFPARSLQPKPRLVQRKVNSTQAHRPAPNPPGQNPGVIQLLKLIRVNWDTAPEAADSRQRRGNQIIGSNDKGRNVATMKLSDGTLVTDVSIPPGVKGVTPKHSERVVWEKVQGLLAANNNLTIDWVYTEREPCGRKMGHQHCNELLEKVLTAHGTNGAQTNVYFSFDYPDNDAIDEMATYGMSKEEAEFLAELSYKETANTYGLKYEGQWG